MSRPGHYVTCAVCGGRRRFDGRRVRAITQPETFVRDAGETVTVEPPAHVCDSHFRVREYVARTTPPR